MGRGTEWAEVEELGEEGGYLEHDGIVAELGSMRGEG